MKKINPYLNKYLKHAFLVCFTLLFICSKAQSIYFPPVQKDTSAKKKIEIIRTDSLLYQTLELGKYRKLIGDVILRHDGAKMFCDSALIDIDANYMTAYGNQVHIKQGDSVDIYGNFLEYFGDQKLGRLTGMCSMRDNTMVLTTPELNYNMENDVGNYMSGGTVISKETKITSAIGYFYHRSSTALFYGDVVMTDPNRTIYADSLRYNTEKEIAYFITKTTIIDKDSNVIVTNDGYYDTKNEKAFFGKNATIKKGNTTVKAESIDYDNKTKKAIAIGNAMVEDSVERTTILSNYIYSDENSSYMKAYKDPLMITVSEDEKDTMFLSADTLLSYKIANLDSIVTFDSVRTDSIINTKFTDDSVKIVKAYYKMKLIQGEMSAVADSLFYSEKDSIFKLYINPIMWMDSTQITGDSIFLYTKNKEIYKVDVFGNAFVINLQDEGIYNQIKGKFIQAFISDKKIRLIEVDGNAESIYFIKDGDRYSGANKSTSALITVSFNDGEVNKIKLTGGPEAVFTPMKKLNLDTYRLDGFKWYGDKQPLTKYDVIRDKNQYAKYVLEHPQKVIEPSKDENESEEKK